MTTKEDRNFHGYGLKSIRYVAKKYGGTVTARMEKQWFVLQLLFPRLPSRKRCDQPPVVMLMDNRGLFLYKNTIRENRIRDEFNNLRRLCAAARRI